jgi:hypothetical protein
VPAEGIFYTSEPKFSGTDEVVYGVRRADGRNQLVTIKIIVGDRPRAEPKEPKSQTGTDL